MIYGEAKSVFPACAGVILPWDPFAPLIRRIPRVCGGDPEEG